MSSMTATSLAAPRILVVGDADSRRLALQALLGTHGFATGWAGTAAAAIETLANEPVDAVLADVVLAGKHDGLDVARWARRHRPATTLLMLADAMPRLPTSSPIADVPVLLKPVADSVLLAHLADMTAEQP